MHDAYDLCMLRDCPHSAHMASPAQGLQHCPGAPWEAAIDACQSNYRSVRKARPGLQECGGAYPRTCTLEGTRTGNATTCDQARYAWPHRCSTSPVDKAPRTPTTRDPLRQSCPTSGLAPWASAPQVPRCGHMRFWTGRIASNNEQVISWVPNLAWHKEPNQREHDI